MKAIFITFDQAHYDNVLTILERSSARGFTSWQDIQGRGSKKGEPHYGSHAWPSTNASIMSVVEDEKVETILAKLRALDQAKEALGLRAFVLPVEQMI